jgi:hypothetical protein
LAVDLQHVRDMVATVEDEYTIRHEAFRALRRYWHGDYWRQATEASGQRSIQSIFRDLGKNSQAAFPDIKLVHNVIQEVCVKYQTFLAPTPMIQMYVDPPETDTRKQQATTKERYLYGLWRAGKMAQVLRRDVGWFLPLMGDVFLGCFPDFDKLHPVPIIRSPEHAYPISSFGGDHDDAIIFHWKERDSVLARTFPNYTRVADLSRSKVSFAGRLIRKGKPSDPMVEVFEYSDDNEFARFAGLQKLNGVDHSFGFNIFNHLKFIEIPGEVWGHGAVEQAINLNEMGNALYSLLFQAVLENVFPTLVLIDPAKAPEEIMRGPGSVIPINPGGSVEWLHPPVNALASQIGFLGQNTSTIKEATGMPPVNFGQSPASSIVTGAAISELQGAGTGSTVEMVQSGVGLGLTEWNQKALYIQQTLFRDDKVTLHAAIPSSAMDMQGTRGAITVKGSQLIGSGNNEVVFSPAMNQHEKLVMWLQAKGGGLVSDRFIRNQIGIPDSEAMDEEILGEQLQQGVMQFYLQQLSDPSQAAQIEDQGIAYIEGTKPEHAPPTPHPLLNAPGGPNAAPPPTQGGGGPPVATLSGGGQEISPALMLPPGSPPPQGGAASPPPAPSAPGSAPASDAGGVTIQDAMSAFQSVQLQGRAWLVGEIVAKGSTSNAVEIAITNPDDQAALQQAAQFPTVFHRISGEPQEQSVEITSQGVSQ